MSNILIVFKGFEQLATPILFYTHATCRQKNKCILLGTWYERTNLSPVDDPLDIGDGVGVVDQTPEVEVVSKETGVRTLDGYEAGRNWKKWFLRLNLKQDFW